MFFAACDTANTFASDICAASFERVSAIERHPFPPSAKRCSANLTALADVHERDPHLFMTWRGNLWCRRSAAVFGGGNGFSLIPEFTFRFSNFANSRDASSFRELAQANHEHNIPALKAWIICGAAFSSPFFFFFFGEDAGGLFC